jgi:hypothetical protein
MVDNPKLSAVFVHPMYGPNGFRETEREARTFQNVLTATYEGSDNPLEKEIAKTTRAFHPTFNIATTTAFGSRGTRPHYRVFTRPLLLCGKADVPAD